MLQKGNKVEPFTLFLLFVLWNRVSFFGFGKLGINFRLLYTNRVRVKDPSQHTTIRNLRKFFPPPLPRGFAATAEQMSNKMAVKLKFLYS